MSLSKDGILKEIDDAIKLNNDTKRACNDVLHHVRNLLSKDDDVTETAGYKKGLRDAWELCQKLWVDLNITSETIHNIYGCGPMIIPYHYNVEQALAKMQEYENSTHKITRGTLVDVLWGYSYPAWHGDRNVDPGECIFRNGVYLGEDDDNYLIGNPVDTKVTFFDKKFYKLRAGN